MDSNLMTRPALGNIASIGDLYDARSDQFCGLSIFKKEIPEEALTLTDADFSDIQLIHSDDLSEKFHKLDVKAELQVSVLAGLFSLEGSGHYLKEQKKSAQTVKNSLLYNIRTRDENLNVFHEDLKDAYSIDAIECGLATHIVVGVSWGANSVLTCEYQNTDNKDIEEIEGGLQAELRKFSLQINGEAEVEFEDSEIMTSSNFSFQIHGDVLPGKDDLPTDVVGALNFMKQMPSLVETCNDGKGKPLAYRLIPINLLQKYLEFELESEIMLQTLEEECLLRIVDLFEEMSKTKQRIYDIHKDAKKYRYCVKDSDLEEISSVKNELKLNESKLRSKLATVLVEVRSGQADVSELEDLITEFESGEFSSENITLLLDKWADLLKKVSFVKSMVEMGATYIGYGVDLEEELLKEFDAKSFILYYAKESSEDSEVWHKNRQIFFQELKKNTEGCKTYVVDCEIYPDLMPEEKTSCIQVVKNGRVLSEDLRIDQEQQESIPFAQAGSESTRVIQMPNKRSALRIPCPGESCDQDKVYDWICKKCDSKFEWGFDDHVYCDCGQTPANELEFKCPDMEHGVTFVTHGDLDYYGELLSRLRPFNELNILLLGEAGVGKSTWINGFVNFLKFSTLDEAEAGEIINLIPSEFTVSNEDSDEIVVKTGEDENEIFNSGQSTTQKATVYSFPVGNTTIRMIDTPGIGDVRGVDQDKQNIQNILDTLDILEELHGICIFLKSNDERVNVAFQFCVKELLTHFHKDASNNIVFCFTNSRETSFQPGDTMPLLSKLLSENEDVDIAVSSHTVYCYDSEAYRFLAAVKNDIPVEYSDDERINFSESWDHSISETARMLEHIRSLTPHNIGSTISLNHARAVIPHLSQPLADVGDNVNRYRSEINAINAEIEQGNQTIEDLESKLEGLSWSERMTGGSSLVPVNPDGTIIGEFHMGAPPPDPSLREDLERAKSAQETRTMQIQKTQELLNEYNNELSEIQAANYACAQFLRTNAIFAYNDFTEMYLDHLISEENEKVENGEESEILDGLTRSKTSYIQEHSILQNAMDSVTANASSDPEEMKRKVENLKNLNYSGQDLQKELDSINNTASDFDLSCIKHVPIRSALNNQWIQMF